MIGIPQAQWPFAGLVWPSEEVLAQIMSFYCINERRILEVGCGIGLASLVLNERMADITATDIHPSSGDNLQHNAQLNNGRHIPFLRTAWADQLEPHFGPFDAIIGSDLLYEQQHPSQLASFIQKAAKSKCEVLLVDANRGYGYGSRFRYLMQELGFQCKQLDAILPFLIAAKYTGSIFRFRRNFH